MSESITSIIKKAKVYYVRRYADFVVFSLLMWSSRHHPVIRYDTKIVMREMLVI